jgi:hypothetical protein
MEDPQVNYNHAPDWPPEFHHNERPAEDRMCDFCNERKADVLIVLGGAMCNTCCSMDIRSHLSCYFPDICGKILYDDDGLKSICCRKAGSDHSHNVSIGKEET